jgi:hypothetical protein
MEMINVIAEDIEYRVSELAYRLSPNYLTGQRQIVLVNGTPKTGTTWVVSLIASIPGYKKVGNFKGKIENYRQTSPGDVVHGHDVYTPELQEILRSKGVKVIATLRDPRDQCVSRMFHVRRDATHSWNKRLRELSEFDALMECIEGRESFPSINQLMKVSTTWLDGGYDVQVIRYESLKENPVREFRKIADYLNVQMRDGLLEQIVRRNRFERLSAGGKFWRSARAEGQEKTDSHFRKGIVGDWRNHFEDEHKKRFKEVAGQLLIDLGYETDLNW